MVSLVVSTVMTLLLCGGVFWYAKRRPVGTPLTWGEAMLGAGYVFLIFFLAYGVVPDRWLLWADNELNWREDRLVFGPGDILKPQAEGGWLPFTINYRTVRDLIAVGIYGVALGVNIWMWAAWQNRGKQVEEPEPVSEYGRPLVKEGAKA